uniref:Glycoside hydrolase 32 family protein n=1 Tax=Mayetiola destructor TaxID=39758 RepID=A0A6H1NQ17_MAYDE|nr:glycoside hydrolase 32 family protein [Mayetiola destructor]
MLKINILIVAFSMISSSFSLYDEKYRPQIHFSPPNGWINDPNGLVYFNGIYHMFFQNNPYNTVPANNIHWGHAISRDLIHWKSLSTAIYPKDGNLIFSGGAIIDEHNVTGLRTNDNRATLIAVYAAHHLSTNDESQWISYSHDGPFYEKFRYYKKNAIIRNPNRRQKDFRDPFLFKYKDHYVITIAAHDRIMIFNSRNLLNWKLVSEFGVDTHGRVWECPSLFPINATINGAKVEKWVLTISLTGNELPNQQYFIGSFDGKNFKNDHSKDVKLWLHYGPDSYAGIVYNKLPDGRRIFISWMNKWEYAQQLNFNRWNGQMGIAQELRLIQVKDQIRLASLPVRELKKLRTKQLEQKKNIKITNDYVYKLTKNGCHKAEDKLDIEMTVDLKNLKAGDTCNFVFSGSNEYLNISLKGNEFTLDRSHSGRTNFTNFAKPWKCKRQSDDSKLEMRFVFDLSSIEVFIDGGMTTMTALFFSKEDIASKMQIRTHAKDSSIILKDLKVYRLKSIWNEFSIQSSPDKFPCSE